MMSRFCRYIDKCFHFSALLPLFKDSRKKPQIPASAVFASVFALFTCHRTSLNILEKDLIHFPKRLRGLGLRLLEDARLVGFGIRANPLDEAGNLAVEVLHARLVLAELQRLQIGHQIIDLRVAQLGRFAMPVIRICTG